MTTAQIQSSVTLSSDPDSIEVSAPQAREVGGATLVEPITLARAKDHLRIGPYQPDEDDYIQSLIVAARVMAEGRTNRSLVQRQFIESFPAWCSRMALLKPPLVSVDRISYYDTDGFSTDLGSSSYDVYDTIPTTVALAYGTPAPALRWRPDAVRITYTAGYAEGEVPASILHWMLLVIGTLFENRSTANAGTQIYSLPDDFMQWMIQPYVVYE